jgi:signal transduction histidine kinase
VFERSGFKVRYAVLLVAVTAALLAAIVLWRNLVQHEQIEHEMFETTQVLATEMDAVWDFMEYNQAQFKRHEDGTYNLYCVVAAKAVAKLFTQKSGDFTIHYTNLTTRKPDDAPDAFELEALEALQADPSRKAYYQLVNEPGTSPVFRYVEPLYYKESCLECHGEPAGTLDLMGYPREGRAVGDLAGAASIIMPADTYLANARDTIIWETAIFGVLMLAGAAIIFWFISRLNASRLHRLEELNRQQSDFLTIMSHEVRTPLTSILAFANIWSSTNKPRSPEEASIMKEMRINSQILLAMINNILEMARADAGRLELVREPVELPDLLAATRGSMSFIAERKRVQIYVEISRDMPVVSLDEEKVRRILENLISNALKFVDEDGSVWVGAHYDFEQRELALVVRDNGCGIKREDQPYIFERFVQGHDRQAYKHSGSGLGLAVVKEMTELHGGSVTLECPEGEGCIFTVRLPANYEGGDP